MSFSMIFFLYFLSIPGVLLAYILRLGNSLLETITLGFWIGVGILITSYLFLSIFFPIPIIDGIVLFSAVLSFVVLLYKLRSNSVPLNGYRWKEIAALLIFAATTEFYAAKEINRTIDDDGFMHLPVVTRIALGDIPPHNPYFPAVPLMGHTGRDLLLGIICRFTESDPILSIWSVSLALIPFMVFALYVLLRYLTNNPLRSVVGSFFVLISISVALPPYCNDLGLIFYPLNNNPFAYGYLFAVVTLLICYFRSLNPDRHHGIITPLFFVTGWFMSGLAVMYGSHFLALMIAVTLLFPFIIPVARRFSLQKKARILVVAYVALLLATAAFTVMVMPGMRAKARAVVFKKPAEVSQRSELPGVSQEIKLRFPKEKIFHVSDVNGLELSMLSKKFLSAQGISFFIGFLSLLIAWIKRDTSLALPAFFGGITWLWISTVDLGVFRAESLRVVYLAQAAFSVCYGFIIADISQWLWDKSKLQQIVVSKLLLKSVSVAVAIVFCGYYLVKIARIANTQGVIYHKIDFSAEQVTIKRAYKYFPAVDSLYVDSFFALRNLTRNPKETVMINFNLEGTEGLPFASLNLNCFASAVTGLGITGVGALYKGDMSNMYPSVIFRGYRGSLFWYMPSELLLRDLRPSWMLFDPAKANDGIKRFLTNRKYFELISTVYGESGRKIQIYQVTLPDSAVRVPTDPVALTIMDNSIVTRMFVGNNIRAKVNGNRESSVMAKILVYDRNKLIPVNYLDTPVVDIAPDDKGIVMIPCTFIQEGQWKLVVADYLSGIPLHQEPINVTVKASL